MTAKQPSTWTKTIVASMTSYIDAGSIVAGAAGLTIWETYLRMDSWQVGLLGACSSNAMSAALGALIGGYICDRYGRKLVYTYDLLFYILGMLLIVFGVNYPMLLIGYCIVGLSVGADVVASWTLIAENAPAENRARHCGTAQVMWALGPAVVLILSVIMSYTLSDPPKDQQLKVLVEQREALMKQAKTELEKNKQLGAKQIKKIAGDKKLLEKELEQWPLLVELNQVTKERDELAYELAQKYILGSRIVFAHLILIAFITWIMRLRMPESDSWVASKEKEQELIAQGIWFKPKMSDLFFGPNLKGVLFLFGVYTIWNLAAGTMGFFLPRIYEKAGGVSATMASALTVLLFLASCLSTLFIFMRLADKYSRRMIYCVVACLFIIAWSLFLLPPAALGLPVFILIAVLMGVNNGSGQQAFYQMWGSELFPARYRASAQGVLFFAARIFIGLWSLCVPVIMDNYGFPVAAAFLIAFATISMLIGTIFCPDTAGKTLEQIEEERYGRFNHALQE